MKSSEVQSQRYSVALADSWNLNKCFLDSKLHLNKDCTSLCSATKFLIRSKLKTNSNDSSTSALSCVTDTYLIRLLREQTQLISSETVNFVSHIKGGLSHLFKLYKLSLWNSRGEVQKILIQQYIS